MKPGVTGIVLAGGRSRRMGRDKAMLPFGGVPLLTSVVRRVAMVCEPVIVVARDLDAYQDCGALVIADWWPDGGPLVGLHAGLTATETEYAALVACDLPFVEPRLLAGLIDLAPGWSAVVPETPDGIHPLCAVYHQSVGENVEANLHRGASSLRALLADPALRVLYVAEEDLRKWDSELRSLRDIDTPEEYEAARAELT